MLVPGGGPLPDVPFERLYARVRPGVTFVVVSSLHRRSTMWSQDPEIGAECRRARTAIAWALLRRFGVISPEPLDQDTTPRR